MRNSEMFEFGGRNAEFGKSKKAQGLLFRHWDNSSPFGIRQHALPR
jgi:hypothetical protein